MHNRLFELIDLSRLGKVSEERVRQDVALATRRILDEQRVLLTLEERERVVRRDPGRGVRPRPARAAARRPDRHRRARERARDRSTWSATAGSSARSARFKDDTHLMRIIEKIVSSVGRRVDELNPMVDARLADGSRVNAIIPPLALDGPLLSIRRFPADPLLAEDLIELGSLTPEIVELLQRRS